MIKSRLKEHVSISVIAFLFAVLVFCQACLPADIKTSEIDPKIGQIEPADWVKECTSVCFGIEMLRNTKDNLEAQLDEAAGFGVGAVEGGIYNGRKENGSSHFSNLQPHIRHESRWCVSDEVELVVHQTPS